VERYGWSSVFLVFGGVIGPLFAVLWFSFVPSTPPTVKNDSNVLLDEEPMGYIAMLQQPVIFSICFAHFAHNLCHFALMSWLPTFLNEKLHMEGDSLAISSLPWMVMGFSVWISSTLADRLITQGADKSFVRRSFTVAAFVIAGLSMLMVALLSSASTPRPLLTLMFLSLALAANGSSTAAGYEAAKLDLTKTASAASRLQSLSNTLATLAGVFGVPLVSTLTGQGDNWSNVFTSLACAFFVAALVFHSFGRWSESIL
jgi:sugar phosphate permease